MTLPAILSSKLIQSLTRLALPSLLFATAVMGTPAQAALTTDTSGNVPYYTELSLNEQSAVQTRYNTLKTEITAAKAKAMDIRIRLNAGETTVTEADYTEALKAVTKLQEAAEMLYAYIHEDDGKPTTGTNTGSSGGSGSNEEESEGGDNPFQQIGQQFGQQLLGQLLGGGSGNFGGLGGNTGGLLGSLTGGNTGGLGTNTGNGTPGGYTPTKTAEQIIAEKNAAEKEEKERAEACAPATTDTAPGKAADDAGASTSKVAKVSGKDADDDINAGGSVEKATANAQAKADAAAKKKAADRKKFNCDIPLTGTDVNNPNPTGKGGVSLESALAMEASNECQWGANSVERNKCECASLAKKLAGLDRASTWRTGAQATSGMAPGAIATMDAGGYCDAANRGGRSGCHAAYYLGTFNGEIKVIEQWNSSGGPVVSTWSARKLATYNRIISGQQTSMFHPFNEPPLWMVLNLKPFDMGLLKS